MEMFKPFLTINKVIARAEQQDSAVRASSVPEEKKNSLPSLFPISAA